MRTPIFDYRFENIGKLHVKNDLWKNGFCALIVREFLNLNFNERFIGRGRPFEWPPCSPDLTSPDLFLCGYIKYVVFAQRPTTREDLMNSIQYVWTRANELMVGDGRCRGTLSL